MSTELVWNIIKNNSCFLRKQKNGNRVDMFSADKMNVTNVYSPKCIGFCQRRAIGVNLDGKRIMLTMKSTKNTNKPAKYSTDLHVKSSEAVAKQAKRGYYRPVFEATAVARYNALSLAMRRAQRKAMKKAN